MEKIYVFGHKKPDTDAVCGSIALSYLKNKLGMKTEPRILSEINKETAYALNKFDIPVPKYLNDVKIQIKDINYGRNIFVNQNEAAFNVYHNLYEKCLTGIPLVNDNNKFIGYVSFREITHEMIEKEDLLLDTSFNNLKTTLKASKSYEVTENIIGKPVLANIPFRLFINATEINKDSIIILANTEYILDYAIESKVQLIIITNDQEINKYQINQAKKNGVNILITPYDIFKTSRIIALTNPIKVIKRVASTVCFEPLDYLSDFLEVSNKLKHTNYPIVDGKGICEGMLRVIDTGDFNKKQVILVDHNEPEQSVDGLNEAEIIEIVDHHNIGDINTNAPINFRNMSVGSVNTIIYYLFQEQKIKIPKDIAGIMLSGVISDTLLLASPTTTEEDQIVAKELAKLASLNLNDYGLELLQSGVSIEGLSVNDVIYKDFKNYTTGEKKIGVAQVFTTSFEPYELKLQEYVNKLNEISTNNNYKVVCFLITDIINNDSYLLFNPTAKKYLEDAFNINELYQGYLLKKVVSRKKQIVPLIMEVIEKT